MNTLCSDNCLTGTALSFRYGRTLAVDNVSLTVKSGDLLAVAGPNGSGKSTLMRLLSGSLQPEVGEVMLRGQKLASIRPRARARYIAVVPQHIDPKLMFSVRHMVAMGRSPYLRFLGSLSAHDLQQVDEALEVTQTRHLAERQFAELSGGEQQRVILAMALAQETDFLLLDEPTVHLDLHHQHSLLEFLWTLNRATRKGIVAVMHDLNLAALYFDRLALMDAGRLVAVASPAEVISTPGYMSIFGAPLTVVRHPQTGAPQVLLERTTRDRHGHGGSAQQSHVLTELSGDYSDGF